MEVDPTSPIGSQFYTILRIKRKRYEEPLDALVIESTVRRKKRGGLDVFQFAETVEPEAWGDRSRDLQVRISALEREQVLKARTQPVHDDTPHSRWPDTSKQYKVVTVLEDSSPIPDPSSSSLSSILRDDKEQLDYKLYDAVLSSDTISSVDLEIDKFLPLLQEYLTVGTSDPVFMQQRMGLSAVRPDERPAFPLDFDAFRERLAAGDEQAVAALKLGGEWVQEIASGKFRTWEDLTFLRSNWDGPLVVKGVQTVEDAHAAMDAHIDGIVVSNHGGRQVDDAISAFSALEKITASSRVLRAQKEGTFTVLFDSGIRQGSDVIKAIAMGAQGVLVGRPFMYGLAVGGEQGVEEVLRSLLADTEITLGLSGYKSIEEIWARRGAVLEKECSSAERTKL